MLTGVSKGIAFLCLALGVVMCAAALGVLPADYVVFEAPSHVGGVAGGLLVVVGLALLARDHRGSEVIAAILLLAFSFITGWLTFYGSESIIEGGIPFIPTSVGDSVSHLLFGLGVVACGTMAFLGLRRLFR
jgi:hypothetical protein